MKYLSFICILMVCCLVPVQAQILFNNGAPFFVGQGAVVQVNGDAENAALSVLTNHGDMTVTGNYENNGLTQGNGLYMIAGNWVNNSTFDADTSTVALYGGNQLITGSIPSQFYNLNLLGSGIKTLTLEAFVLGTFFLNDLELATGEFTLYVVNTSLSAIVSTDGFVSSTGNGTLSRTTQNSGAYFFPVGSSAGTLRYRPVELTPSSSQQNTFTVRMANVDATIEGYDISLYDSTVCEINPLFYHRIFRSSGNDQVNIKILYDSITDGAWNSISQWSQLSSEWQGTAPATSVYGSPFSSVSLPNWNNYSTKPYILTVRKANATISPATPVCESHPPFNLTGADPGGIWSGNGITGAASGEFNPHVSGPGSIQVVYTIAGNCGDTDTANVTVYANPSLGYESKEPSCIGADDGYVTTFPNTGQQPIVYVWSTGSTDGSLTGLTAGTYTVSMTDALGCIATQSFTISDGIIECTVDNVYIPNIFSPNGDNQNDILFVRGSTIKNLSFIIYDRWGERIFQSNETSLGWDGTYKGKPMDQGVFVYYAVIELFDGTIKKLKGNVTLIR